MAIISFSMTVDELLAGEKTVTRRDWKSSYMWSWQQWYEEGRLVHDAYDQIPIAGGEKIGEIRLTDRPYWERLDEMPESDLAAEGGMVETLEEFTSSSGFHPPRKLLSFDLSSFPNPFPIHAQDNLARLGFLFLKLTDLADGISCSSGLHSRRNCARRILFARSPFTS
jgi:hypothetical protein